MIELLVVLAVILILASVTIASVNFSNNADRMRSGGRQIQSFLMGARDKAIYANEVRGVRFILDPNDNHSASAMLYIGAPKRETGTLTFNPIITMDSTGRVAAQVASLTSATPWGSLYRRGFLQVGNRIQIPQNSGSWFTISSITIDTSNGTVTGIVLNRPCQDLAGSPSKAVSYLLELSPVPLGDTQPVQLPRGVVIDLDGSKVPLSWRATSASTTYLPQLDVLFTPRGTVVGGSSSIGILHLLIADASDVLKWKSSTYGIAGRFGATYTPTSLPVIPADNPSNSPPIINKDRVIVSLTTRTGNVAVYPMNPTPQSTSSGGNPSLTYDPFSYAESGQVANK